MPESTNAPVRRGHNGWMTRPARRGARPEVSLENYAAVYDYFGPGRRRDGFAHPLLRLATLLWAPRLEIDDDVVAEINRLHEAGTGVVLAANHPSGHDALVLASAVWDERVRFLSDGTGLAKDSLFNGLTRPLFEYTGTIPVFRAKNYPRVPAEVHVAAARAMIDVCADRLRTGGVVLSFVEGTNSAPDDLRALRPESVKRGVGQIIHGCLAAGRPVALLPAGISYRGREHAMLPPRRATVRAGRPVVWEARGAEAGGAEASGTEAGGVEAGEPVPTVDEVRDVAREAINAALAEAWRD